MLERRLFARIKIKMPLRFLNISDGMQGTAETIDISAEGVGFITKENLSVKSPLEMWLAIPQHDDPVHLEGEVVWSKILEDKVQKRVGVHFKEERLLELSQILSCQQPNQIAG